MQSVYWRIYNGECIMERVYRKEYTGEVLYWRMYTGEVYAGEGIMENV